MCWTSFAAAARTAQRFATKTAGQKIACVVKLLRFSLKTQGPRFAAASRRKGGALMITLNAFAVRPAGVAGSRHAAHAAVPAAAHKRIAAATERPWIEALPR
jgi:hypothetical protein